MPLFASLSCGSIRRRTWRNLSSVVWRLRL